MGQFFFVKKTKPGWSEGVWQKIPLFRFFLAPFPKRPIISTQFWKNSKNSSESVGPSFPNQNTVYSKTVIPAQFRHKNNILKDVSSTVEML